MQLLSEKAQPKQERLQPCAPVPVCEGSMRGAPARRSWSGSSRPQLCTRAHCSLSMLAMRARHSSRLSSCEVGAAACASVSGATCSAGELSTPCMHVKLRRNAPSSPCKTSCCAQPSNQVLWIIFGITCNISCTSLCAAHENQQVGHGTVSVASIHAAPRSMQLAMGGRQEPVALAQSRQPLRHSAQAAKTARHAMADP